MKNFLFIIFLLGITVCKAQEFDSWEKIKKTGKGKLSIAYFESPGLIYSQNNQLKGLCIDLINDFVKYVDTKYGKTLSIDFVSNEKDFGAFLNLVQRTQNLLGVSGVTISESRKALFSFTPPFLASPMVLITNKSASAITNLKELKDFTPSCLEAGSQTEVIKQIQKKFIPGSKINSFPTPKEVLENVDENPKSFTILGLNDFLDASRKKLKVKMQNFSLGNPEIFGFIMSKNSDWDVVWNEFLTENYLNSPEYKKSIARNLGSVFLTAGK